MSNKSKKISDAQIQTFVDEQMSAAAAELLEKSVAQDSAAGKKIVHARLLRRALRDSAPKVPTAKMWKNIRAQLHSQDPQAFPAQPLLERWTWLRLPVVRVAFGASFAILIALGLRPNKETLPPRADATRAVHQGPQAAAAASVMQSIEKKSQKQVRKKIKSRSVIAAKNKTILPPAEKTQIQLALLAPKAPTKTRAAAARPTGSSAVERALENNNLDEMIRRVRAREEVLALTPVNNPVQRGNNGTGDSVYRMVAADGGMRPMSNQVTVPLMTVPRIDKDGFWNWSPAAVAMNKRDWGAAGSEFDLARREASESSERSFGASARLLVNSMQGVEDDLGLGDLRRYPGLGLVVLNAGSWQLLVPRRQAHFIGEVKTRLAGFRSEGPGFVYELNFDRGEFAAGTSFIRMAGELSVTVVNSEGETISDNTFAAPQGAEFNFATGELRLK